MDLREEAVAKNAIIKYLLDNQMHHDQPKMFRPSDFYTLVFDKKLKSDYVERLVQEIFAHPDVVVQNVDDLFIGTNSITQRFYDSGGFVDEFNREQEANIKLDAAAERSSTIEELQVENLQLSNELSNQKIKTHLIPIGISIVGLVVAALPYITPFNNVIEEQITPKIDSIENRLKQLENGLHQKDKEVDQLKEELYKAEMMVRVLEETKP